MSSEFEKLAADLELLAKAAPATEEDKVLAAAKDGGVDTDQVGKDGAATAAAADGEGAASGATDPDQDGDEVLGKSFQVMGGDGEPVKAYDATDLIKSLNARVLDLEGRIASDKPAVDMEHLGKSFELVTQTFEEMAGQIETLQKAMVNMSKQGAGRKSVLTVNEKPDAVLVKALEPDGLNGSDFMAKAMDAQKAGRITGMDVSIAESSLNRGLPVPAGIVSRVMV